MKKFIKSINFDKKLLLIIPAIIIMISFFIIIKKNTTSSNVKNSISNNGYKYNNNKNFIKKQKVDGIVFKNIKCTYDGSNSLISYTMVNETKKDIYLDNYDIIVKDKNNEKLTKISAHVTQTFKSKESVEMANQVVGVDLTDAYSMELKLNTDK